MTQALIAHSPFSGRRGVERQRSAWPEKSWPHAGHRFVEAGALFAVEKFKARVWKAGRLEKTYRKQAIRNQQVPSRKRAESCVRLPCPPALAPLSTQKAAMQVAPVLGSVEPVVSLVFLIVRENKKRLNQTQSRKYGVPRDPLEIMIFPGNQKEHQVASCWIPLGKKTYTPIESLGPRQVCVFHHPSQDLMFTE